MVVEGQVVKFHGGFCYVMAGGEIRECLPRRRLAEEGLVVGDHVRIRETAGGTWAVEEVLPRRTLLVRPPVANVELAVIVFSVRDPDPNFRLLDRLLVVTRAARIEPLICFNKIDLALEILPEETGVYSQIGYRVIFSSARTGAGVKELREAITGRLSVFAGPSGAGKSSLLNAIQPGLQLKTGEISPKTRRGRHTTRLVELLPLAGGGFVADTPGFTQLDLPEIEPQELAGYFPEIAEVGAGCRFNDCLHLQEPQCAVRQAVDEGRIALFRYRNYTIFLQEIRERERRYWS